MEAFLTANSLFVVLGIALIIWVGLGIYLALIDRKITKLEQMVEDFVSTKTNE
ncbi:hypothetical protein MASR1M45_12970 [Candidatus Kapaibacterium sp.]